MVSFLQRRAVVAVYCCGCASRRFVATFNFFEWVWRLFYHWPVRCHLRGRVNAAAHHDRVALAFQGFSLGAAQLLFLAFSLITGFCACIWTRLVHSPSSLYKYSARSPYYYPRKDPASRIKVRRLQHHPSTIASPTHADNNLKSSFALSTDSHGEPLPSHLRLAAASVLVCPSSTMSIFPCARLDA